MEVLRSFIFTIAMLVGFNLAGSNAFLISSNYTGRTAGKGWSDELAVTPDGRYVAFASSARDMGPTNANGVFHIYLLDRVTGVRKRITNPVPGSYGPSAFRRPVLSEDGRFVGFHSMDIFPVPGVTNYGRSENFFVHDTLSGRSFLGSPNGNAVTTWGGTVEKAALSADGRYSSFQIGGGVYRADLEAGTNQLVTIDRDGNPAYMLLAFPRTPDHRFFVFASTSSNMVAGLEKTNGTAQVYWRDMDQNVTKLVSVATNGGYADTHSFARAISRDGRYVAFRSSATNLQPGMGGQAYDDIFIRDMLSNQTWCVTVNTNGTGSTGNGARNWDPEFSADGSRFLFQAPQFPPPLIPEGLYIHHLPTRTNRLLATNTYNGVARLSSDGRYALFASEAGSRPLMSVDVDTLRTQHIGAFSGLYTPLSSLAITADGRWTFFVSPRNEAAGVTDTNNMSDIFAAPTVSPRIENFAGTGTRTVETTAFPGDTVQLQRSTDLENWSSLATTNVSASGTATLQDNDAPLPAAFYRLASPGYPPSQALVRP